MLEQNGVFWYSLDNVSEMIIICDERGVITYANRSAIGKLKYDSGICGQYITELLPEEFTITENKLTVKCQLGEESQNTVIYRKNRTCFPVRIKVLTYPAYSESVYICMVTDVSMEVFYEKKAKSASQENEEAQKVKTEFVANVTHELRTPVHGILGNAQELIRDETERNKLKHLHLIERGCHDMNAIINNILDFSKLDAGKFVLEQRKFRFRDMIEYIKGNHSKRIIEKGLDFSITVSPEIPEYIIGDELRIVQILNNLISNAYKFTSVGSIHVEVIKSMQSGNNIKLFFMVVDTGIGIKKEDQSKLFQSFSQVDASITRKYGGTGLGLNICKQLVELMSGGIYVESERGKGSIFSFDIWVECAEECPKEKDNEEISQTYEENEKAMLQKLHFMTENQVSELIWKYGTPENKAEIDKKMSKLILCIEMENWEKAEMFADTVKQLLEEAPREIKSAALRMKLSVQRGDYQKAADAYEGLKNVLP